MMVKIKNARLVTETEVLYGQNLYFENGFITAVGERDLPYDAEIDAHGCLLSPGWIDIHSHGGGDADFMDGTVEAFCRAAELHAQHGTTTIVPTATSGTFAETMDMIHVFQEAQNSNLNGADMPGLHLEGP